MPPATVGPAAPIEPPFAATPFTVGYSRTALYSQITRPVAADKARSTPSQPPEKTAPGIAVERALLSGMLRERGRGLQRREPFSFAIPQLHRGDPTRSQPEIGVLLIGGPAPHDLPAKLGGVAHQRRLPHHRALAVGIVRPDVAALLPRDQHARPSGRLRRIGEDPKS